jgi:hypothetical protein
MLLMFLFYALGLDSCVVTNESYLESPKVWMWCTIYGIYMLCVICVMTTIVVSVDIGTHDNHK